MTFSTSYYPIRVTDPDNQPAGPFSVAVLADLHDETFGKNNEDFLYNIERIRPEAILCAGDLVTAKAGRCYYDNAASLVRQLCSTYPVYCVNGNHELRMKYDPGLYHGAYRDYMDRIQRAGATVLENASAFACWQGMRVQLTGYEADLSIYHRVRRHLPFPGEITRAIGQPREGCYHIMLAHHPDLFDECADWGADLTLSGHFHGGMVRLPGLGGVIGGSLKPFPRYDRGLFQKKDSVMVVSAGLGSHTIKLRINNPPELVVVTFEPC